MSKEKRFVIQVDPLEIEDDAIYDNKELRLYECQSDMMSDICSLLNQQDQQIAELEEQLKNARKETAKKVIARVEELGVFDFEAYEERYIISEMELDNILKEYGE